MSGDVNDYSQGDRVEGMGEWVSGDVNDYSQGDRVEGMGEWGCEAEILEPLAYTTPSIQLNVATLYKTKLLSPRRSLRAGGRGFPPGYNECGSWLLLLENKRNLEPKDIPSCSIPHLHVLLSLQDNLKS